MAKRLFMQLISCVNVLTVMQNGLQQLEDEWKAFKAAHPVMAKKLWYTSSAQDFIEEGIAPDLQHAIEMVKELRKHRLPLIFCQQNSDRYVDQLTPLEFRGLFRMDRQLFDDIHRKLEEHFRVIGKFQGPPDQSGKPATAVKYLLSGTMRWLAGGSPHDICYFCGLRIRTFRRVRWDVIDALKTVYFSSEIKLPETELEREILSGEFEKKMKMKGCLGAIDGLLCKIVLFPGLKSARPYLSYKGHYSVNMQAVAGPNGEFLYVNVGHAGASGDGCAARQSLFWRRCAADNFKFSQGYFFIGDAAYSLMPWLMTPFEGPQQVDGSKDVYNNYLSKGRQVVERAFGMMISRWRILVAPLDVKSIGRTADVIKVCCILHNLCLRNTLSKRVVINRRDEMRHPFRPECTKTGVVPRVRLHADSWRTPGGTEEERRKEEEKVLKKCALAKRQVICTTLHSKGNRRVKTIRKRSAAYQMMNNLDEH